MKNYIAVLIDGEGISIPNVVAITITETVMSFYTELGEGILPTTIIPVMSVYSISEEK